MQSTSSIFNASRTLARPASRQVLRSYLQQAALGARFSSLVRPSTLTQDSSPIQLNKRAQLRAIQSSAILSYSLADPATTSSVQEPQQSGQAAPPAEISTEEYHQRADIFMDELVAKLEDLQEQRDDLEVDYSVCVTSLELLARYLKTNPSSAVGWSPHCFVPSSWNLHPEQAAS